MKLARLATVAVIVAFGLAASAAADDTAAADQAGVRQAIDNYVTGWRAGDVALLSETFATEHGYVVWLDGDDAAVNSMTFGDLLANRRPNPGYGDPYRITHLDVIDGELAIVKFEVAAFDGEGSYVDVFLLQKEHGRWRVVTKTFVSRPDQAVAVD